MWYVASTRSSSGWCSWMRTLTGPWTGPRSPCLVRTHCSSWMGSRYEVLWALEPTWRTRSHCSSHLGFRRQDVHLVETRGGYWQRRTRLLSSCRQLPCMRCWGWVSWGWVRTELRLVGVRWLGSCTLYGPSVKPRGSGVQVIGPRRLCGGSGGVKGRSFYELSCRVSFRLGAQLNRQSKAQRLGKPLRIGHKEWLHSSGKLFRPRLQSTRWEHLGKQPGDATHASESARVCNS